jgi:hypothetical protein
MKIYLVTQMDNYKYLAVTGLAKDLEAVREVIKNELEKSRQYDLQYQGKEIPPLDEAIPDLTNLKNYRSTTYQVEFIWELTEVFECTNKFHEVE